MIFTSGIRLKIRKERSKEFKKKKKERKKSDIIVSFDREKEESFFCKINHTMKLPITLQQEKKIRKAILQHLSSSAWCRS